MPRKQTYMIEGEWTGYRSSQQRVVHRHYCNREKVVAFVQKTYGIRYTDGTMLLLSATPCTGRKRLPVINSYNSLIEDCVHYDVSSVDDLHHAQERVKNEYAASKLKL